jgi:Tol biopolymer transport system component
VSAVWTIKPDGTDLKRVADWMGEDDFPVFSPDGRWIAFGSNVGRPDSASDTCEGDPVPGPRVIWLVQTDGTNLQRAFPNGGEQPDRPLDWLPDPA